MSIKVTYRTFSQEFSPELSINEACGRFARQHFDLHGGEVLDDITAEVDGRRYGPIRCTRQVAVKVEIPRGGTVEVWNKTTRRYDVVPAATKSTDLVK